MNRGENLIVFACRQIFFSAAIGVSQTIFCRGCRVSTIFGKIFVCEFDLDEV